MNKKDIYTEKDHVYVTLETTDGESIDCRVLTRFPMNGKQYIVLLPETAEHNVEESALVYIYEEDENGDPILSLIEDDEEFEMVADRYDEIMDEQEFDELVPAEED